MKWHNLMILLASLALISVAFADELDIPEDIDEDELGMFEFQQLVIELLLSNTCFIQI
jgi:hypothetical protein